MTAVAPLDEVVLGLPEARLRPFVDRYVGYRERADLPLVRREAARDLAGTLWTFGTYRP